jgi:hypothetical protein
VKEWKYGVIYHKDGDHIELYNVPFWVTLIERLLDNTPILWWASNVPGGHRLFSKGIFWLDDKRERIALIPASPEILAKVAPGDEWLWGDSDELDYASNSASG